MRASPKNPRKAKIPRPETPRKVTLGGIPFNVVSDAEAEKAEAVIVMPDTFDSPFKDNLRGTCSSCGIGVIFRPHVPKNVPKLCINCAVPLMAPPAGNA